MNISPKLAMSGIISTWGIPFMFLSTQILWFGLEIGIKKLSVFMILLMLSSIFQSLLASVVPRSSIKRLSSVLFSTFEKLSPLALDSLLRNSFPILDKLHSTPTPITRISYFFSPLSIIVCTSFGL